MERVHRVSAHVTTSPVSSKAAAWNPNDVRAKALGKPSFDIAKMTDLLDHDHLEMRRAMRESLKDPIFTPVYNVSVKYEREVALERLRKICENKFISVLDFKKYFSNIFELVFLFIKTVSQPELWRPMKSEEWLMVLWLLK